MYYVCIGPEKVELLGKSIFFVFFHIFIFCVLFVLLVFVLFAVLIFFFSILFFFLLSSLRTILVGYKKNGVNMLLVKIYLNTLLQIFYKKFNKFFIIKSPLFALIGVKFQKTDLPNKYSKLSTHL